MEVSRPQSTLQAHVAAALADPTSASVSADLFDLLNEQEMLLTSQSRHSEFLQVSNLHLALLTKVAPTRQADLGFLETAIARHCRSCQDFQEILTTRNNLCTALLHFKEYGKTESATLELLRDLHLVGARDARVLAVLRGRPDGESSPNSNRLLKLLLSAKLTLALAASALPSVLRTASLSDIMTHLKQAYAIATVGFADSDLIQRVQKVIKSFLHQDSAKSKQRAYRLQSKRSSSDKTKVEIVENITGGVDPLDQLPGLGPELLRSRHTPKNHSPKPVKLSRSANCYQQYDTRLSSKEYRKPNSQYFYRKRGINIQLTKQPASPLPIGSLAQQIDSGIKLSSNKSISPKNLSPAETKPPEEHSLPVGDTSRPRKKSQFAAAIAGPIDALHSQIGKMGEWRHSSDSDHERTPQKNDLRRAEASRVPSTTSASPATKVNSKHRTRHSQFVFRSDANPDLDTDIRRSESYTQLLADRKPEKYASLGNFGRVTRPITVDIHPSKKPDSQSNMSPESPLTNYEQNAGAQKPYFSSPRHQQRGRTSEELRYRNSIQIAQQSAANSGKAGILVGQQLQLEPDQESDSASSAEETPSLIKGHLTQQRLVSQLANPRASPSPAPPAGRSSEDVLQTFSSTPHEIQAREKQYKSFTHGPTLRQSVTPSSKSHHSGGLVHSGQLNLKTATQKPAASSIESQGVRWQQFTVIEEPEVSKSVRQLNGDTPSATGSRQQSARTQQKSAVSSSKLEDIPSSHKKGAEPSSMTENQLQRALEEDQITQPPLMSKPSVLSQTPSAEKDLHMLRVTQAKRRVNISLEENMQEVDEVDKKSFRLEFGDNVNLIQASAEHVATVASQLSFQRHARDQNPQIQQAPQYERRQSKESNRFAISSHPSRSLQEFGVPAGRDLQMHEARGKDIAAARNQALGVGSQTTPNQAGNNIAQQPAGSLHEISEPVKVGSRAEISPPHPRSGTNASGVFPIPVLRVNNKPYLFLEDHTPVVKTGNQNPSLANFSNMLAQNTQFTSLSNQPSQELLQAPVSPQNTMEIESLRREFELLKQKNREQDLLLSVLQNKLMAVGSGPGDGHSTYSGQNSDRNHLLRSNRSAELSSPSIRGSAPQEYSSKGVADFVDTPTQSYAYASGPVGNSVVSKQSTVQSAGVSSWNTPDQQSKGSSSVSALNQLRPPTLKPSQFSLVKAVPDKEVKPGEKSPTATPGGGVKRPRSPRPQLQAGFEEAATNLDSQNQTKDTSKFTPVANNTRLELKKVERTTKKELTVVASAVWETQSRSQQGSSQQPRTVHPRISNFKAAYTEPITVVKTYDLGLEGEIVCILIKVSLKHIVGSSDTTQLIFELMSYKSKKAVKPTSQTQLPPVTELATKPSKISEMSTDMMTITEGMFFKLMDTCDPEGLDFYPNVLLVKNSLDHYMSLFVSRFLGLEIDESKRTIRPSIKRRPQHLLQIPGIRYNGSNYTICLVHKNMFEFWIWIDSSVARKPKGFKKRIEVVFDKEAFEANFNRSSILDNHNSMRQKLAQMSTDDGNSTTFLVLPNSKLVDCPHDRRRADGTPSRPLLLATRKN